MANVDHEAANIYTHPAPNPKVVLDAAIGIGSNILASATAGLS